MNCTYCEGNSGFRSGKPGAMEDFRKSDLKEGNISTQDLLAILEVFRKVGFNGITLTGGEPMLNPEWDLIINEGAKLGFDRNEITTNGILLEDYFKRKKSLPEGLTLIKVSFDTIDKEEFYNLTGGGNIDKVINGVKTVSPYIKLRANKVMLRSNIKDIERYLEFCHEIGFHEVNLLDLVMYPNRRSHKEHSFFNEQYISSDECMGVLNNIENLTFKRNKYGHEVIMKSGIKVMLKDSSLTLRDKQCETCTQFCQEGKFTVRVATDGNITMCPDFNGDLYSINGIASLKNGSLEEKITCYIRALEEAPESNTMRKFMLLYGLKPLGIERVDSYV